MFVWNIFCPLPFFILCENDFFMLQCEMQHNQECQSCDKSATTEKLIFEPQGRGWQEGKRIGRTTATAMAMAMARGMGKLRKERGRSGSTNSTSWHVCLLTVSEKCVCVGCESGYEYVHRCEAQWWLFSSRNYNIIIIAFYPSFYHNSP